VAGALAAALAAGFVALGCRYASVEEAFTAELLRDAGKVVLDQNLPEPYQEVVELVHNDEVTFLEAEHKILGFGHAEVGALVVKKWTCQRPWRGPCVCTTGPCRLYRTRRYVPL
jgi:HD-like signal output (HDOD) protein